MLLILVVETNDEQGSDRLYIEDYIKHFYNIAGIKLKFIPMCGKGNYRSTKVLNKINKLINEYKKINPNAPLYKVIYFIDLDNPHINAEQYKLNEKISVFTKEMDYDLVYFNKNIENVFLKRDVESNQKQKEAVRFVSRKHILKFDNSKCSIKIPGTWSSSNIDLILSKYLNKTD